MLTKRSCEPSGIHDLPLTLHPNMLAPVVVAFGNFFTSSDCNKLFRQDDVVIIIQIPISKIYFFIPRNFDDGGFKSGTKVESASAHSLANFAFEKADLQNLQLRNDRTVSDSRSGDYAGFAAKYLPI